ncbi:MAG: phospholipase D-like domain-containing protein, partial [Candidatus Cloacimonetes bacterium]|nr:phospholipase D-like domain-containing protein [Candidatus Cloacimonadota bacterium]
EAAIALQAIFLLDWLFVNKENLLGQTKYLPSNGSTEFVPDNHIVPIQVAASGPDTEHANILQLYFVAITSARKSIRISSPYLILNESLRMALRTAAISGVKVQIILPCKPDHFMVFWASRSYFKDLMDVGVEIWEYQKGFYHTKLMIVDDAVLLIGTVNMDLRSFNHNFELTATIYQESICRVAIGDFEDDLSNSRRIDLMEFNRRSVINKSKESLCRLVSPLL